MPHHWNDKQPIYQQLYQRIIDLIVDGTFLPGEAVPSVRQLVSDYKINHLTVAKSYQMLVDEGILENRRGVGMFVKTTAPRKLLKIERKRFFEEEWPAVEERILRLGLDADDLLEAIKKKMAG